MHQISGVPTSLGEEEMGLASKVFTHESEIEPISEKAAFENQVISLRDTGISHRWTSDTERVNQVYNKIPGS